jgi:hypothetical protein
MSFQKEAPFDKMQYGRVKDVPVISLGDKPSITLGGVVYKPIIMYRPQDERKLLEYGFVLVTSGISILHAYPDYLSMLENLISLAEIWRDTLKVPYKIYEFENKLPFAILKK